MSSDLVLSKRVHILNDDVGGHIDVFPNYAIVKLSDWSEPRRFELNREKLYYKLHVCCGICYFDIKRSAKVELEPLYELIESVSERMVMIQFAKIKTDSDRAKVSFKELVEALSAWK